MPVDVDSALYRKIQNDRAFIVSEYSSVADGGAYSISLENPTGSGKTLWIFAVSVSSTGTYRARIYDAFDSTPSNGTEISIDSLLLDSENDDFDGAATATENPDFIESNGSHAVGVGGGGSGGQSVGGTLTHPIAAVEPNREIVVEVSNTGTETEDCAVSIAYFERDRE